MVIVGYEVAGRSMAAVQALYAGSRPRKRVRLHSLVYGVSLWLRQVVPA